MKKWREHSEKLSDYYGWVTNNMEKSWDANLISYNATGINLNKDEFFGFCLQQIQKEMILDNFLYIYFHDLACCYGSDSIGIKLAFIFKKQDRNEYWK